MRKSRGMTARGSCVESCKDRKQTVSHTYLVASYSVNRLAIAHARGLIEARQYVLDSDWGEVQPRAEDENTFLEGHAELPFGGYRESGIGRELGRNACEDYTESKTVHMHLGERTDWWLAH